MSVESLEDGLERRADLAPLAIDILRGIQHQLNELTALERHIFERI